eukprot:UN10358
MRGVRGKKSKPNNQQQQQQQHITNDNNANNTSSPSSNPLLESVIATFNRICAYVAPHTDDLNDTNYTPPRIRQQNKSNNQKS